MHLQITSLLLFKVIPVRNSGLPQKIEINAANVTLNIHNLQLSSSSCCLKINEQQKNNFLHNYSLLISEESTKVDHYGITGKWILHGEALLEIGRAA